MNRAAAARAKAMPALDASERALRVQLAAGYRIIDHMGWSSLIWTHTTLRVPGPEHHFLINPYQLRYDEIRASSLVKIDLDGRAVEPTPFRVNEAGFVIHSAIHRAREDAHCVLHTHTAAGMAVAALADGLLPISMYAIDFYDRIAYHEYEGPSLDVGERERLMASLGQHKAMILRNHGLMTIGRTVAEAFVRMYRLEMACQVQLQAMATGARLSIPSPEICREQAIRMDRFLDPENYGVEEFDAFVRLVDQKDPSFRD